MDGLAKRIIAYIALSVDGLNNCLIFNLIITMKQFFILMSLLFVSTIGNAQQSETSGSKTKPNVQKAPQGQMRFNFAEQEAIVNKFTTVI